MLLDALGTLVELEPPAPRLRRELSRRFDLSVDETSAQRAIAAEIAYYRQHLDEGRDPASLAELRRRCAAVLSAELAVALAGPVPGPPDMTEALLAALEFRRFPDVLPALGELRHRGVRTLVVSNWDVSLHDVLERLGVSQLLGGVLTSAEVGARKPQPEIFARALAQLGVSPGQALHVGDSLQDDVAGARKAAIAPVLIHRSGSAPAPRGVPQITSLAELTGHLLPGAS